jgi:hypothetical protein
LPWFAHWLAFGTFLWASSYFRGSQITLADSLAFSWPGSLLWFLATPFIIALARRVRLTGRAFAAGLATLIAAGLALHVGFALIEYALFVARVGGRWHITSMAFLADWSITDLIRFGVVVAGTRAVDGYRTTRLARRRAQRLRAELAEAELELLHLRLQPHFLFNALSAISELVHVDADRADRALVAMGDLLRRGLATSGRPVVSLAEELEALDAYVALERMRWTHRLDVTVDAEPRALALGVPNFALQPVVENCLRHGFAGRERGAIRITARVLDARLVITIEDDGAGLAAGGAPARPRRVDGGGGLGLANVRERLARLYGDAAELVLGPGPRGGAVARLTLPTRPVAPPIVPPVVHATDAPAVRAAGSAAWPA